MLATLELSCENFLNSRLFSPGAIPVPLSFTETTRTLSMSAMSFPVAVPKCDDPQARAVAMHVRASCIGQVLVWIVILCPPGVYLIALDIRLIITCCRRKLLALTRAYCVLPQSSTKSTRETVAKGRQKSTASMIAATTGTSDSSISSITKLRKANRAFGYMRNRTE